MNKFNEKPSISVDTINFLMKNVYNVSDLTRKNKLTEILQRFVKPTEEVFIVQNAKNKDAQAALINLKYFEELLRIKEMMDQAIDQVAEKEAADRLKKGKKEKFTLSDVLDDDDIDFDQLNLELKDED
ncbi:hypothetical protein J9303_00575 [Bacillaceae bacterium Marseille-Q3522]|nr:hypothetical protein [Bacillaceae bacterium Marseille-Q3522]